MRFKKAIIYYWSGTGNTFRIASWVHSSLKRRVRDICITSITEANPRAQITQGEDTLVLITMPTHGFTAPWAVIAFCLRLPMRRKTNAITIANGGGYSYFGHLLPGVTGSTNLVVSLILLVKGYRIQGCTSIDMPGSWPALVPALKKEHIDYFLKHAKRKTEAFIRVIASGNNHFFNVRNIVDFIFGVMSLPVSCGYLLYGRLFFAKLQFANLNCDSCGICARYCSHNAILMKGKGTSRKPYWTFKCESCGRCISFCPRNAIEAGHSMGVVMWFAVSLSASYYFLDFLFTSTAVASFMANTWILKVRNYVSFIITIFFCYYAFYYLVKIPFINRIFAYTSGTHWWKKYHEPSLKSIRELKSDSDNMRSNPGLIEKDRALNK